VNTRSSQSGAAVALKNVVQVGQVILGLLVVVVLRILGLLLTSGSVGG